LNQLESTGGQTLIQMVPQCGEGPNGVADYAMALARALRPDGIESVFLSGTPCAHGTPRQDEWKIVSLPRRQSQCLADTIHSLAAATKAVAVLLHFSGYGYEKRGAPLWLLQGLRNWHRRRGGVPLVTIFHELYATGRPWQSSYWLSPLQKLIARGILKLSSDAIAPTELYRDWLLHRSSGARISCMPVFSNVGEPSCQRPPCARAAAAVIFGLAGVEDRLFGLYRADVEHVISTMAIEKIFDIGPRFSPTPSSLAGVPVFSKGALPPLAVSELLQHARFGFIAYPFDALAKSGVFAAYAAHGLIPIIFPGRRGSFDGLEAGRHFLDGLRIDAAVNADGLALIQRHLSAWYASHSLQVQASLLERSIKSGTADHLARFPRSC
jgi:hypothetical protein